MRRLICFLLAATFAVFIAGKASAQSLDGTLRVTVTDGSQASIEDAKVTVTNEDSGVAKETSTSSAGTYVFPNMLVGNYTIAVEKSGFKKSLQKGIIVTSNKVTEATVVLELGSVSAVVEVEAGADLVQTQSSEINTSFAGQVVNNLPLNTLGGDVKEFAVFVPGTTTQQGGVLGSGGSIGGTRPRFNGFNIDGVDDNRIDVNGPVQPVIQESIAEFSLLTNQFSAEYGHSAGGIFNIITKSGTNNWHGAAWEFNRNRDLDAATNQEKQQNTGQPDIKNRFDYNRFGASIGGPIKHDKLFIYGAYEFQNEGLSSAGATVVMPTAAGLAQLMAMNPNSAVLNILNQFPLAPTSNGDAHCNAGAGDNKPSFACVNSQAIDVGTFQSVAPSFSNQHDFTVNADANLGKHQLRGRFLFDRLRLPQVNPVQPQAQFTGAQKDDARKGLFTDAWSISPRWINDFRASYSRLNGPDDTVPGNFSNFPNVEIDEFGSNVGPFSLAPQGYVQNIYQLSDAVTTIRGKHTFKFGVEGRKYIAPTNNLPRARGEWDYKDLNRFINDLVPNGLNGALRGAGSGTVADNYNSIYWFVQDDWKITPRLTLNLGLRYEYNGVPRAEGDQALNAISNDPGLGLIFRKPHSDKNNFGPHLGFAYDPRGNGKWAIRGGFQIAYDVVPNNFAVNSLPPQLQTEQKPAVTCALPGAPAWCTTGTGFLAGGGLLQVNVPPPDQATARAATSSLMPDHVSPKVLTWSLGIQHELFRNSSIEIRYVGTRGLELPVQRRLNSESAFDPNLPGGPLTALPTYLSQSAVPATVVAPASTLATFDNFNPQPLSGDGFFGNVTTFPPAGWNTYHGVSVDFQHRFTKGLFFRTNYTFSKNIDNATNELFSSFVNPRRAQDGFNLANEKGLSALNNTHKFAMTFVYDFPNVSTSNGFVKALAHGWEWNGTYLLESGQPVTALSGSDANANGDSAGDRTILNPNGVGRTGTGVNFVCNAGPGGATSVISDPTTCGSGNDANIVGYVAIDPTARYVQAEVGTIANVGRNTITTPGINIWNMGFFKTTKVTERFSLQFRASTYNTFNHRNFSIGLPTNNGAIDQANNANPLNAGYIFVNAGSSFLNKFDFDGGSRNIELGLKLIF
ncbi:MAG TPA: TonB-dependent receptor [Candidatus Dormibacteraeota bacterium]|nr:TonB-dependent receptor [Candidatus Dormibacteraeota bacterium]